MTATTPTPGSPTWYDVLGVDARRDPRGDQGRLATGHRPLRARVLARASSGCSTRPPTCCSTPSGGRRTTPCSPAPPRPARRRQPQPIRWPTGLRSRSRSRRPRRAPTRPGARGLLAPAPERLRAGPGPGQPRRAGSARRADGGRGDRRRRARGQGAPEGRRGHRPRRGPGGRRAGGQGAVLLRLPQARRRPDARQELPDRDVREDLPEATSTPWRSRRTAPRAWPCRARPW